MCLVLLKQGHREKTKKESEKRVNRSLNEWRGWKKNDVTGQFNSNANTFIQISDERTNQHQHRLPIILARVGLTKASFKSIKKSANTHTHSPRASRNRNSKIFLVHCETSKNSKTGRRWTPLTGKKGQTREYTFLLKNRKIYKKEEKKHIFCWHNDHTNRSIDIITIRWSIADQSVSLK